MRKPVVISLSEKWEKVSTNKLRTLSHEHMLLLRVLGLRTDMIMKIDMIWIWSNDYYQIESIHGVNAILRNGKSYKFNNLQIIEKPDEEIRDDKQIDEVKRTEAVNKHEKYLNKEGINVNKIIDDPYDRLFKRTTRSSVKK